MAPTGTDSRFATLGSPQRIWTVSSIYGDMMRLETVHNEIYNQFAPGDRLIYFGSYTGGDTTETHCATQTIDQLLFFRKCLLALPGVKPEDIVYLRGIQEELWQKLLQLQFAHDPANVLEWMIDNGLEQTLSDYGGSIDDGRRVVREGILSLTRWTNSLRQNIRRHPGHIEFMSSFRRAAFTETDNPLLFVHSGIDIQKPLNRQSDNFWWNGKHFNNIDQRYDPFSYVIRGFDPNAAGLNINGVTMSLDSTTTDMNMPALTCSLLSGQGEVLDVLSA